GHSSPPVSPRCIHALPRPAGSPLVQRVLVLGPRKDGGDPARHARNLATDPAGLGAPVNAGSSTLYFDGVNLSTKIGSPGRRFRADPECLRGGSRGYAHVCALPNEEAKLPFDFPEIQQVRREALAWWIPMLGESLVCLTTLAVDSVNYGGGITVARDAALLAHDPFARIFPGT